MTAVPPPVLLGLRDAAAAAAPADFREGGFPSKFGGAPDRIPSVTPVHPACGICKSGLVPLVQISCPLEGSPFHRVLHVFACAVKSCWGKSESWKVLRSQYLEVQKKGTQERKLKQKEERVVAASDWCEGADDWGDDGEDEVASSGFSASCSLNVHSKSDCLPREWDCTSHFQDLTLEEVQPASPPFDCYEEEQLMPACVRLFQPYYISVVDEEDYHGYEDTSHAHKLLKEYQQREGIDVAELTSASYTTVGCNEIYEKSEAEKIDLVFHKFMKRISVCPEQILRYSWGGQPLFITSPPTDITTAVPPCNQCRSRRIFEFQLMPALVSMLQTEDRDVSVEFGTALVFTCEKSCWPANQSTPLEEFIFVQEDPDQQFFK
uniref:Programmed cell death protein 2-like n=1 Tax=Pogona vitticeps TaxID=103695 RepID=A0ABM5EUY6_9SAUR